MKTASVARILAIAPGSFVGDERLGESHLKRLLRSYRDYCHNTRTL